MIYEAERTLIGDIRIAIGEASMCWQYPEQAGAFDAKRASKIADELYEKILDYV